MTPRRVCVCERFGNLCQYTSNLVDGEWSAVLEARCQIVAIDARHDEEDEILDFIDGVDGNDVWMAELRGGFGFAQETRPHVAAKRKAQGAAA